jgi:hypothetical protein
MSSAQPIECDIVLAGSDETLVTLSLPVVPRVGEELDLDVAGARGAAEGCYLVVGVRYHARPRKLTRMGDLFGVRIVVQPIT